MFFFTKNEILYSAQVCFERQFRARNWKIQDKKNSIILQQQNYCFLSSFYLCRENRLESHKKYVKVKNLIVM